MGYLIDFYNKLTTPTELKRQSKSIIYIIIFHSSLHNILCSSFICYETFNTIENEKLKTCIYLFLTAIIIVQIGTSTTVTE